MDLIQNFMDKESDSIISELISQGFSAEQANRFLPEALATLVQGLKGADMFGSANSDGLTKLSDSVDFDALSARTGVDSSNAETGLKALIPRLIAFLKDNRGQPDPLGEQTGGLTSVFKSLHH
jgi:hypothetical protein